MHVKTHRRARRPVATGGAVLFPAPSPETLPPAVPGGRGPRVPPLSPDAAAAPPGEVPAARTVLPGFVAAEQPRYATAAARFLAGGARAAHAAPADAAAVAPPDRYSAAQQVAEAVLAPARAHAAQAGRTAAHATGNAGAPQCRATGTGNARDGSAAGTGRADNHGPHSGAGNGAAAHRPRDDSSVPSHGNTASSERPSADASAAPHRRTRR